MAKHASLQEAILKEVVLEFLTSAQVVLLFDNTIHNTTSHHSSMVSMAACYQWVFGFKSVQGR